MITDFEEFCLCCYVLIDDLWRQIAPRFPRPGPDPVCSDSELLTLGRVILDFELAPANATDLAVGEELLSGWPGLVALADKAYTSAKAAQRLREEHGVVLLVPPRRNQKRQLPARLCRQMQAVRSIIETVNGQLAEQFRIEINHAHSFGGLCARLYTKLTAHTLCVALNRHLGNADFLQIKALAFPI